MSTHTPPVDDDQSMAEPAQNPYAEEVEVLPIPPIPIAVCGGLVTIDGADDWDPMQVQVDSGKNDGDGQLLLPPDEFRLSALIVNNSGVTVYLGRRASMTRTVMSFKLVNGSSLRVTTKGPVYALAPGAGNPMLDVAVERRQEQVS